MTTSPWNLHCIYRFLRTKKIKEDNRDSRFFGVTWGQSESELRITSGVLICRIFQVLRRLFQLHNAYLYWDTLEVFLGDGFAPHTCRLTSCYHLSIFTLLIGRGVTTGLKCYDIINDMLWRRHHSECECVQFAGKDSFTFSGKDTTKCQGIEKHKIENFLSLLAYRLVCAYR